MGDLVKTNKKNTIKDMRQIAREKGGECLSKNYFDNKTKLIWRCAEGHEWEAVPSSVKFRTWCPYCAGTIRLTIEEMREIAKERGGECLSDEYVNNRTKLKWKCSKGHEWEAAPSDVKYGRWCPDCGGRKRLTIELMQILATEKGGKCLSSEYINNATNLHWRCSEGHEWWAMPATIRSGGWCPHCAKNVQLTITEMQELAKERGGECLSKKYVNTQTNLKWRCADGHEWKAIALNVKRGTWCPHCTVYVSEKICRGMFERIFEKPFPKKKPKWLINPDSGFRMELDGFCSDLNIAFEYQGKHHYQETKYAKDKTLAEHIKRDKLKRKLCNENNIKLIAIPYDIEYENLPAFIIEECKKNGIDVPNISLDVFDYRSFDIYSPGRLDEMRTIAKEKGGDCLSKVYINEKIHLNWRCNEGHEWGARPDNIKSGKWCPYCAGTIRLTIEEMREIAKERGGECLSDKYTNVSTKLKWRCKEGHEWMAIPYLIKRGSWCPACGTERARQSRIKDTIQDMKKIANERGGDCLSNSYINDRTHLIWQCAYGHEWEATPSNVKRGTWCPICARNKKS